LILDIRETAPFADYFIICSGTSRRMLTALMSSVKETMKNDYSLLTRQEGEPEDGWLLADFGDIVLHIFSPEQRQYYQLEKLWSDGKVILHVQ
jgi:ribosome-associated protein